MLQLRILEENRIDPKAERVYLQDDTGIYGLNLTTQIVQGQPIPITSGGTIPAQSIVETVTSPTGYGGLNQERSDIAVFILGYQVNSRGVKSPLSFDSYDPATSTNWVAQVPQDGWLSFKLVYCVQEGSPLLTDYAVGDFVYDIDSFQLLKVESIGGAPFFVNAYPEELLGINSPPSFDQLFIGNSSVTKLHLNKRYLELLIENNNLSNQRELNYIDSRYRDLRYLLEASIYEFVIGNKYEAARILEFLITNNYNSL